MTKLTTSRRACGAGPAPPANPDPRQHHPARIGQADLGVNLLVEEVVHTQEDPNVMGKGPSAGAPVAGPYVPAPLRWKSSEAIDLVRDIYAVARAGDLALEQQPDSRNTFPGER